MAADNDIGGITDDDMVRIDNLRRIELGARGFEGRFTFLLIVLSHLVAANHCNSSRIRYGRMYCQQMQLDPALAGV